MQVEWIHSRGDLHLKTRGSGTRECRHRLVALEYEALAHASAVIASLVEPNIFLSMCVCVCVVDVVVKP